MEKFRDKYNTLLKDQYLNLSPEERAEIIAYIRTHIHGYTVMEWCGSCVVDMLKLAFRLFDENKKSNDIHTPNSRNRRTR